MNFQASLFVRKNLVWLLILWLSIPLTWSAVCLIQGRNLEFSQAGALLVAFAVAAFPLIQYLKNITERLALKVQLSTVRELAWDRSAFNLELILSLTEIVHKNINKTDSAILEKMELLKLRNQKNQLEILSTRLELTRHKSILDRDLVWHQRIAVIIEVFVVFIGTLQWGYGVEFVSWLNL